MARGVRGLGWWLPRVLLLGWAASLVLPLPAYLAGLAPGERQLWVVRLVYVLAVPAVLGLAVWLGLRLGAWRRLRRAGRRR
jgi:hypothetical protein